MKNKSILNYVLIVLALLWAGKQIAFKFFPPTPAKEGFPLTQKWMTKFGSNIFALSVAHDGTLLVRTAYLNAIDPTSGQLKWRILLDHEVHSDAGMERDGVIYVTTPTSLLAIQLETGDVLWEERIAGGYLVAGTSENAIILQNRRYLSAHDATTGTVLWELYVGNYSAKVYVVDNQIFAFTNGIVNFSNSTGEKIWETNTGYVMTSGQSGDFIFFSTSKQVGRFDTKNKMLTWGGNLPEYYYRKYVVWNDVLIVTDPSRVIALDIASGNSLWEQEISFPVNPTLINNMLFVMEGFSREIFVLDASTGIIKGKLFSSIPQLLYTERNDMVTSERLLIFARGNRLFAFGE